jgi:hypothetical protein
MISKAPRVVAPEKELRFTRSGQAIWFWLTALLMVAATVVIIIAASGRITEPERIHPALAIIPLIFAWLAAKLALRLTRHAYLILTPLGIEIFPFLRPAENMQLVGWGEIADAEVDDLLRMLTLHFNAEQTAGIHLSLRPIREDLRPLLAKAILERIHGS